MQNVKFSLLVIKLKQYFPCMQIWLSLLKCRGLTGKCIKYTIYVDAYEQCEKNIQLFVITKLTAMTMAQTSLLLRLIQGILFFWIDPIPDMALLTVQYLLYLTKKYDGWWVEWLKNGPQKVGPNCFLGPQFQNLNF